MDIRWNNSAGTLCGWYLGHKCLHETESIALTMLSLITLIVSIAILSPIAYCDVVLNSIHIFIIIISSSSIIINIIIISSSSSNSSSSIFIIVAVAIVVNIIFILWRGNICCCLLQRFLQIILRTSISLEPNIHIKQNKFSCVTPQTAKTASRHLSHRTCRMPV